MFFCVWGGGGLGGGVLEDFTRVFELELFNFEVFVTFYCIYPPHGCRSRIFIVNLKIQF
jgi:hypothetical protein